MQPIAHVNSLCADSCNLFLGVQSLGMINEYIARMREQLIAARSEIDQIVKATKISRRTLYYIIEGKSPTVETIDLLSRYFERATASPAPSTARDAEGTRLGRVRARNTTARK